MCQGTPQATRCRARRRQAIEPEQRGADDRWSVEHLHPGRRRHGEDAALDAVEERAVAGPEEAAAEHYVDVAPRQVETPHGRDGHGDDPVGLFIEDGARHRVALGGAGEDDRRQLGGVVADATGLDGLEHGEDGAWNDFYGPLVYLGQSPQAQTLSLALSNFRGMHHVQWNLTMAATLIFMIPVVVIFFLAQRVFIEGVTLTGVKG